MTGRERGSAGAWEHGSVVGRGQFAYHRVLVGTALIEAGLTQKLLDR